MERVTIRFYEELNDFLPPARRKRSFEHSFLLPRSVKDLVESLGVPHVEIDLILVNGESVGFDRIIRDGDRISVYPVFEQLDVGSVTHLRPKPLRRTKFVLDVHLRKLTRRLRMLGFDVRYDPDANDQTLATISATEMRVLLTRDLGLIKRSVVTRGLYVRATDPEEQIGEILDRLDLYEQIDPFTRCIRCNGLIHPIEETTSDDELSSLLGQVPAAVREWCSTYDRCDSCGKIYWKGSHFVRMQEMIEKIISKRRNL